jgi:ribulose-phosphate 3-epimerase
MALPFSRLTFAARSIMNLEASLQRVWNKKYIMKKQAYLDHPKVAASILSGDFGHLADESKRIEDSGADYLHVDVMDGHFVPNLTMGPLVVSAINRATQMFLDVHLMVYNPFDYVERFIEAGADMLTIHFEATEDVEETLNYIRRCNIKAGLAFCPETSLSMIPKFLDKCDMILLMTVHPGFGGQAFMPEVLEKVKFTRDICNQLNICEGGISPRLGFEEELAPFDIEVDGGIDSETAMRCIEAGANVLVSGTYLFKSPNIAQAVQTLRGHREDLPKSKKRKSRNKD